MSGDVRVLADQEGPDQPLRPGSELSACEREDARMRAPPTTLALWKRDSSRPEKKGKKTCPLSATEKDERRKHMPRHLFRLTAPHRLCSGPDPASVPPKTSIALALITTEKRTGGCAGRLYDSAVFHESRKGADRKKRRLIAYTLHTEPTTERTQHATNSTTHPFVRAERSLSGAAH